MNEYNELCEWLNEEHNEVFHQWAQVKEQLDEEARVSLEKKDAETLKKWKYVLKRYLEDNPNLDDKIKMIIEQGIIREYNWNSRTILSYMFTERGINFFRGRNNPNSKYSTEYEKMQEEEE